MNRRELFGLGGALMAGKTLRGGTKPIESPVIFQSIFEKVPEASPDYKGFKVVWTDWKPYQESIDIVAQYFGLRMAGMERINCFVASTGSWGYCRPGDQVNLMYYYPHFYCTVGTSRKVKEICQTEMAMALKKLIDHFEEIDWVGRGPNWPCPAPPLIHPEIPEYPGWRDLHCAGIYDDWVRELAREREMRG